MLFLYLIKKLLKKRWMVLALLYLEQVMFASLLALGLMKNGQQQHRQIRNSEEYMLADRMIKKLLHTVIRKLLKSYGEICRKRSEERRVGKECRSRWRQYDGKETRGRKNELM